MIHGGFQIHKIFGEDPFFQPWYNFNYSLDVTNITSNRSRGSGQNAGKLDDQYSFSIFT